MAAGLQEFQDHFQAAVSVSAYNKEQVSVFGPLLYLFHLGDANRTVKAHKQHVCTTTPSNEHTTLGMPCYLAAWEPMSVPSAARDPLYFPQNCDCAPPPQLSD